MTLDAGTSPVTSWMLSPSSGTARAMLAAWLRSAAQITARAGSSTCSRSASAVSRCDQPTLTVRTDAFTEWRSSGSGGSGGGTLDLTTIGAGPVEVRGMAGEAGEIIATRVEATNDDRLYLQGPVTSKDAAAGRLVVLGLTIQAGVGTSYRDVADAPLGAAAFFDQVVVPRTVVKARSRVPMTGSTFSADEVEIEGSR